MKMIITAGFWNRLKEIEKAEIAFVLKLSLGNSDKELYMGMLEAAAKLLRIPKYRIYTVDQLFEMVYKKYITLEDQINLPRFVHVLMELKEGNEMNLKGRHFLTLKDYTRKRSYILWILRRN